jgi:hypothetical protein
MPVLRQKFSQGHSPSSELEPGPQPQLEVFAPDAKGWEGSKEARSEGKKV